MKIKYKSDAKYPLHTIRPRVPTKVVVHGGRKCCCMAAPLRDRKIMREAQRGWKRKRGEEERRGRERGNRKNEEERGRKRKREG